MDIDAPSALIGQFRETFEGTEPPWITSGGPASGIFGTIRDVDDAKATAEPFPGGKTIAGHVAHLIFSLELFLDRLKGGNPPADWGSSFDLNGRDWASLESQLRVSYNACLAEMRSHLTMPIAEWPAIHVVGISAMTAHNAYHLGALRQLVKV